MTYREFIDAYAGITEEKFNLLYKYFNGEFSIPVHYMWINQYTNPGEAFAELLNEKISQHFNNNQSFSYDDRALIYKITFPICNFPKCLKQIREEKPEQYDIYLKYYLELHKIMLKVWYDYE